MNFSHAGPLIEPPSPQQVVAMVERGEAPTPEIQRALGVDVADPGLPITSAATSERGLPVAIMKELRASADGYEPK